MKIITKIRDVISGAKAQAEALRAEANQVDESYRTTLVELGKLHHAKERLLMDLSKVKAGQQPGESRDAYAKRMWELGQAERQVKEIDRQIARCNTRLGEIERERVRLRKERKEAAATTALAESTDGAEALAALADAKKIVEDLEAKREAAARHTNKLAEERAAISLQAHTGDESARQRLDAIHIEIGRQDSEAASLEAALTEARAKVRSAEAAVGHQEAARRESEVARISGLVLTESAAFDAAAGAMVAALRQRTHLIMALAKLGVDTSVRNHLTSAMAVNRALARAGMKDFADFDAGGNAGHQRSLADYDSLHIGRSSTAPRAA